MKFKNTLLAVVVLLTAVVASYFIWDTTNNDTTEISLSEIEQKRAKHAAFFKSSPYNQTVGLSKKERKALGLPPNAYYERMWELTMNPQLGYPTPFEVESIDITAPVAKSVSGNSLRPWVDRGPNNVGGRTHVTFFDPNDVGANNGDGIDYNRVFAGGVGGGLWVNDNIASASSQWSLVPGVAANLNISCYAIDPNDSQTIYLGTGEQHTFGAAVGNGVYKSTDGGVTWAQVNIPIAGAGTVSGAGSIFTAGLFYVNDILIRDNNGVSELYVAVGGSIYYAPNFNITNPNSVIGLQNAGLYRSVDDGSSWNRIESSNLSFNFSGITLYIIPNDFVLGADNKIYFGSITTPGPEEGGGRIYSSTDGVTWTLERTIGGADRVELAASTTDPNLFYALAEVGGSQANIYKSTDGFTTLPQIAEPDDADLGIPATDFTRNQAFYDLVIEVDPNDDQIVYAGGIDLHRSTDGGSNWQQISKWSENPNLNTLNVPFIHADIHALTFHPTDSNEALVGSDGGISWASSLSTAGTSANAVVTRNNGYNVTQFYYGSIAQNNTTLEGFIGGAQDNGTQAIFGPAAGENSFQFIIGGDGGHVEIDSDSRYAIGTFQFNNHQYRSYPDFVFRYCINGNNCQDNSDGDFINVAELDRNNDYFFSNSTTSNGSNAIDACELLANSSNCTQLTNSLIGSSRPTALKASPFNTNGSTTLYIGTEFSRLIRVTDADTPAPVWTNLTGASFLGSVSDIEFGTTEQEIFVTMHNYGVQSVWYSDDGGTTWSGKEGNLPDVPVKSILKNPLLPNEVIIGTDMGIYATGDFDSTNPSWVPQINGMTNVKVLDLDLRTVDNTILATTHGRGMFTGTFDTLSIEENQLSASIDVYPTLVTDGKINIQQSDNSQKLNAQVFDMMGRLILTTALENSSSVESIDLNNIKSGYYILNLKGQNVSKSVKFTVK